jgi:hypothetical protein
VTHASPRPGRYPPEQATARYLPHQTGSLP